MEHRYHRKSVCFLFARLNKRFKETKRKCLFTWWFKCKGSLFLYIFIYKTALDYGLEYKSTFIHRYVFVLIFKVPLYPYLVYINLKRYFFTKMRTILMSWYLVRIHKHLWRYFLNIDINIRIYIPHA